MSKTTKLRSPSAKPYNRSSNGAGGKKKTSRGASEERDIAEMEAAEEEQFTELRAQEESISSSAIIEEQEREVAEQHPEMDLAPVEEQEALDTIGGEYDDKDAVDIMNKQLSIFLATTRMFNIRSINADGTPNVILKHKKGYIGFACAFEQRFTGVIPREESNSITFITPVARFGTGPFDFKSYPTGLLEGEFSSPSLMFSLTDSPLLPSQECNARFAAFHDKMHNEFVPFAVDALVSNSHEWFSEAMNEYIDSERKSKFSSGRNESQIRSEWKNIFRSLLNLPKDNDGRGGKLMSFKF